MVSKREELVKGMRQLFPNSSKIITIKETKRDREIARDVRKYVMDIEEAHKRASHSKLRFQ